ncbi:MAG TPA: hypothetical protein VET88_16210 [Gammaproteobacteria bacterium]|nr:hypothetical protein [Gammaproteobacteria bacterium]
MSVTSGSILVLLAVALAGCGPRIHKAGPPPPPTEVTPGSTFTVVKGFLIPSGDHSVFFQDARLYPQGEIQPNSPYCELIPGTENADGELVSEGVFTVGSVTYDESGVGVSGEDISITGFRLKAETSGKSYRMDCMLPLLSRGTLFVSPAEVQGAVAGYMNLKVAP